MTSNLIARVLPYLPGTLVEGSAIDIAQNGTTYTISWDSTEAGFSTFGLALGAAANAAAAQALLSSPLSWRNIIGDNGGFEVWLRGAGASASFAVPASTTGYTADRWYIATNANQASTVAATAGLVNGSNLAAKITRNSGQTGIVTMAFGFPLDTDEIVRMRGQKISLSFVAKAGANWSPASGLLTCAVVTGTGAVIKLISGYTGQVAAISLPVNLTPGGAAASFGGVSAGTIPTNATQMEVAFTWTPVGTAGADDSFTIDDVQLEVQTFASQFERMPFEKMLLGCKRHFWKSFAYGTAPAQNVGIATNELAGIAGFAGATGHNYIWARNPVQMRVAPGPSGVITFNPGAANAQMREEITSTDGTSTTVNAAGGESLVIQSVGGAGTVLGNLLGVHVTVDAGI